MNSTPLIGPGSVRISSARASNGKWIVIQASEGYNALYRRIDYKFELLLPPALNHSAQVVFDRHDPDSLYFCAGNILMKYSIERDSWVTWHAFDEYETLDSSHAEGDLSETEQLALCGVKSDGSKEVFLFDTSRLVPRTRYPQSEPFDGIKAAGDHLILSEESGIYDLTGGRQLTTANGHACPVRWQGKDYLLWCSSADASIDKNAVMRVDIETGEMAQILDLGWDLALHISAGPDGYCVVGTYDPKNVKPSQILMVSLAGGVEDGEEETQILHSWQPTTYTGYDSQPRGTWSQGLLCFNKEGAVWAIETDVVVAAEPVPPTERRVNAKDFLGKDFILRPLEDGNFAMFERT